MTNLERLRELTNNLPLLKPLTFRQVEPGKIDCEVLQERCRGLALLNCPEVAVQKVCLDAGTVFPEHTPDELEVVVLYKGNAQHVVGQKVVELGVGSVLISSPGEAYEFRALTECEIIAITVPASSVYPKEVGE